MKSNLLPKVYEAPNPGPPCPECHSDNTAYSCLHEQLECQDCSELFTEPYVPKTTPAQLFGYTETGGHWYKTVSGGVFHLSKETMKANEDVHIRPAHGWTHYDFLEEYKWCEIWRELDQRETARDFLKSLSPQQLEQLKEQLNALPQT